MENNQGYEIERDMLKWFKGKNHPSGCVDFQTTTSLYEVKSCRLFIKCCNGDDKRPYVIAPHKKGTSTQLGRFFVKLRNHKGLKIHADKENKIPKYIFVVAVGKQKVWRIKSWERVDSIMKEKKRRTIIRIKDLFNEVWDGG